MGWAALAGPPHTLSGQPVTRPGLCGYYVLQPTVLLPIHMSFQVGMPNVASSSML